MNELKKNAFEENETKIVQLLNSQLKYWNKSLKFFLSNNFDASVLFTWKKLFSLNVNKCHEKKGYNYK